MPDVRTQAVAHYGDQRVFVIVRLAWGIEQVAAQLADVDKAGSAVLADFLQETAGGKLAPDKHRGTGAEGRANPEEQARAVIQRQAQVNAVAGVAAQPCLVGRHRRQQEASIGQDRCLRQAGCAGCKDIQGGVAQGHPAGICRVVIVLIRRFLGEVRGPLRTSQLTGVRHKQIAVDRRQGRIAAHIGDGIQALLAEYHQAGVGDTHTVHQRRTCEVGIDQRGGSPQLVEGNQDRQILDAIFQHHADRITAFQSHTAQGAGVAVGLFVEFPPTDFPALENDRRVLGMFVSGGLDPGCETVASRQGTRFHFPG